MLKIKRNSVYLTRGDSLSLHVDLVDDEGNPYVPEAGDRAFFRMKKSPSSSELLIEKEFPVDEMVIDLDPEDTEDLAFGQYVYEVEMVIGGDLHFTVIENQPFELGKELENHAKS